MKKIVIDSSKFLAALRVVSPAVSKNLIVPILGYVKISAVSEKELSVEARNGHLSIVNTWEQDNDLSEPILLPYKEITQILHLVKGDVEIALAKKIVVTAGADVFKLDIPTDAHLFPKNEEFEPIVETDVEEAFFWALGLAKRVLPNKDELRPIRAVNILFTPKNISVIGTDALTMFRQSFKTELDKKESFMIGRDLISVIERFSDSSIKIGEKFLSVRYGTVTVTGVLEDGKYPDVESILAGCDQTNLTIVKADLQAVTSKALLFTPKEGFHPMRIKITGNDVKATLEGINGSMATEITCTSDLKLEINVNQVILNDLLSMIQPDQKDLHVLATESRVSIYDAELNQIMLFQTYKIK